MWRGGYSSRGVSSLLSVVLLVWLIIGAVAAGQRHYYSGSTQTCAKAGTIVVTVLAGPLNYAGVNPRITCRVPQPSR
jgi:hypothetical protein